MNVPSEYTLWLESLGFHEVSFGYGGLKLFLPAELNEAQTGYSRSATGESLLDGNPGSWRRGWIVIGLDTLTGDPIILDTAGIRVMTAMHGEESWEPYPIAKSLQAFAATLRQIKQLSAQRENPVALDNNPIPPAERERVMQLIRNVNDGIDVQFWELFLEPGLD